MKMIGIKIEDEIYQKMNEICTKNGISTSDFVKNSIKEKLNNIDNNSAVSEKILEQVFIFLAIQIKREIKTLEEWQKAQKSGTAELEKFKKKISAGGDE